MFYQPFAAFVLTDLESGWGGAAIPEGICNMKKFFLTEPKFVDEAGEGLKWYDAAGTRREYFDSLTHIGVRISEGLNNRMAAHYLRILADALQEDCPPETTFKSQCDEAFLEEDVP